MPQLRNDGISPVSPPLQRSERDLDNGDRRRTAYEAARYRRAIAYQEIAQAEDAGAPVLEELRALPRVPGALQARQGAEQRVCQGRRVLVDVRLGAREPDLPRDRRHGRRRLGVHRLLRVHGHIVSAIARVQGGKQVLRRGPTRRVLMMSRLAKPKRSLTRQEKHDSCAEIRRTGME